MLIHLMRPKILLCIVSLMSGVFGSENSSKSMADEEDVMPLGDGITKSTSRSVKGRQLYKELVDKLFKDHSPIIPPNADNLNTPMNLSILMVVENLAYLDMKSQTLNIIAWFQIDWYDSAFSWDTDVYPIDMIVVSEQDVWRPVIAVANTLLPRDQIMQLELPIAIHSNGNFRWFPGDSFIMDCHVNLLFYPFDVQTCSVSITQWSQYSHHFNCTQAEIRSAIEGNGEWDIIDLGYHYTVFQEPDYAFWVLKYTITLKRKWLFYVINLIFPIVLVSALTNVVFILPVESGDKMSVSVTAFLTLAVFLTLIQDSLAKNSDTVCYLTLYLAVQMTLGALAIVESAIVVAFHHRTAAEDYIHSEQSSKGKRAATFKSFVDEELPESRLLNEENYTKTDSRGLQNRHQIFKNQAQDEQISAS
ncbi:neuronal acetylcholine receptor subunit alpha-7-like [Babylonia areolata]|uniref:neuronal acetylcholine receptor subunit alpha-7-like n=1 Tax=Babylonia areolata TaxID=304850 RepID=UPI003FD474AB